MNNMVVDFGRYNRLKAQNKIDSVLDGILQDLSVGRFAFAMSKLINANGKINKSYLPILREIVKVDALKEMDEEIKKEMKKLKAVHQNNNAEMDELKANKKAAKTIIKQIGE